MDGYIKDVDSFFAGLRYCLKNPQDFDTVVDTEELLAIKGYLVSIVEKWMLQAFKAGYKEGVMFKPAEGLDPGIIDYHLKESGEKVLRALEGDYKKEIHLLDGKVQ